MSRNRIWNLFNKALEAPAAPTLDATTTLAVVQDGLGEDGAARFVLLRDLANAQMGGQFTWDEYVNAPAADVDYFLGSTATTNVEVVYEAGDLLQTTLTYARRVTITSTSNAAFTSVAVVIVGTDINGNALSDTITTTAGGGATDSSSAAFATIESITIPAQGGAGATYTIGFGAGLGLSKPLRARQGVNVVLREHAAGSLVTNGTFVLPASAEPYGLYTPNSAPNGTNDYAILYEVAQS